MVINTHTHTYTHTHRQIFFWFKLDIKKISTIEVRTPGVVEITWCMCCSI